MEKQNDMNKNKINPSKQGAGDRQPEKAAKDSTVKGNKGKSGDNCGC
jgi:hypothetical protein